MTILSTIYWVLNDVVKFNKQIIYSMHGMFYCHLFSVVKSHCIHPGAFISILNTTQTFNWPWLRFRMLKNIDNLVPVSRVWWRQASDILGGMHKNIGNKNSFNIEVLSHFLIHFYYLLISLNIISTAINDFFLLL